MLAWYLVRTKSGKERSLYDRFGPSLPEVFMPSIRSTVRRWGQPAKVVGPLFPCYLFARFDLDTDYLRVRHASGVRDLVRAGDEPRIVPEEVVADLKRRCAGGPVEIAVAPFQSGERVRVATGPLRGLDAIFDRYLSGAERVAIFLASLEHFAPRVVTYADALERLDSRQSVCRATIQ
jgi:transcriptional antiterminator RfaH